MAGNGRDEIGVGRFYARAKAREQARAPARGDARVGSENEPRGEGRGMARARAMGTDPYGTMYGNGRDPGLNPAMVAAGTGDPEAVAHGTFFRDDGDRADAAQGILREKAYNGEPQGWREQGVTGGAGWARTDDTERGGRRG